MKAHVVDGTYELFRHYHGAPPHENSAGEEVGATRAVLGSLLGMLEGGATHIGVATDHVIESWRNEEWPTYKSSAGVPEDLLSQFELFEEALAAHGPRRVAHDRPGSRRRVGERGGGPQRRPSAFAGPYMYT